MPNVEKCGRGRQAYCFSTAKVGTGTQHNVTLYVLCLDCFTCETSKLCEVTGFAAPMGTPQDLVVFPLGRLCSSMYD
jgi:hypothetical protein